MTSRPKCKGCSQAIGGIIKIDTYRKKVGNKSNSVVDYYCEDCFEALAKEKATNEHTEKETASKRKNHKRT